MRMGVQVTTIERVGALDTAALEAVQLAASTAPVGVLLSIEPHPAVAASRHMKRFTRGRLQVAESPALDQQPMTAMIRCALSVSITASLDPIVLPD
jgi:hypothetical protein